MPRGGQEISDSAGHPQPRGHGVQLRRTGMGKGRTEGLGKPLMPPRGLGPKCFCQGEVKQIDEGPP